MLYVFFNGIMYRYLYCSPSHHVLLLTLRSAYASTPTSVFRYYYLSTLAVARHLVRSALRGSTCASRTHSAMPLSGCHTPLLPAAPHRAILSLLLPASFSTFATTRYISPTTTALRALLSIYWLHYSAACYLAPAGTARGCAGIASRLHLFAPPSLLPFRT